MFGARRSVTLLLALIMGVAAAAAVYALVSKNQEPGLAAPNALPTSTAVPTTPVLIARQDIAAGTQLTEDLLEVRDIPTELRNNRALSSEDQAVGKMAAVALVQGEQILDTRVTDSPVAVNDTFAGTVPVGKRAISVVFDEVIGAGALVQPGDHVDVLAFFELDVKDFTVKSAEPTETTDNTRQLRQEPAGLQAIRDAPTSSRMLKCLPFRRRNPRSTGGRNQQERCRRRRQGRHRTIATEVCAAGRRGPTQRA